MSSDRLPAASPEVGVAFLADELVLYDRSRRASHRLNTSAAAIWAHCDGQTLRAEAVASLAETFGADVEIIAPDVDRLLDELAGQGLFEPADSGPLLPDP